MASRSPRPRWAVSVPAAHGPTREVRWRHEHPRRYRITSPAAGR
jgi:hypothetical protein